MIPILIYINDEDRLKFACINAPGSSQAVDKCGAFMSATGKSRLSINFTGHEIFHGGGAVALEHGARFAVGQSAWFSVCHGAKFDGNDAVGHGARFDVARGHGPSMGSLKSPYRTFYLSSIETIALNCLVFFRKPRFVYSFHATGRQTNRETGRQTDGQSGGGYRE